MKAKELMLFDLVKRKKDGKTMTVVELRYAETIAANTPDDVYYGDMEDYHESEIEPIPLTPEILEKNGFIIGYDGAHIDHDNNLKMYHKYIGKAHIVVNYLDDGKVGIEISNEFSPKDDKGRADLVTFARDWCNGFCVHELQHTFRLCGIEKEIVI